MFCWQDLVVSEGGIPKLVKLLKSGPPNVSAAAAGALGNLACDEASSATIVKEAGLEAMCDLLRSDHPGSQEAAAR